MMKQTQIRNNGDYSQRIKGTWYLYLADKGKLYRGTSLGDTTRMRANYYKGRR